MISNIMQVIRWIWWYSLPYFCYNIPDVRNLCYDKLCAF